MTVYANLTAPGGNHPTLFVASSSSGVVSFTGGALVNAANEPCLSGGGVDGAITKAGGTCLAQERQALPIVSEGVRCPTGDAKVVDGCGDLQVDKVILAVGPDYQTTGASSGDQLLEGAYSASISRAEESTVATVAFPLLSGGIFRGDQSLEHVISLGMTQLFNADSAVVSEVYMVSFVDPNNPDYTELNTMLQVLGDLSSPSIVI